MSPADCTAVPVTEPIQVGETPKQKGGWSDLFEGSATRRSAWEDAVIALRAANALVAARPEGEDVSDEVGNIHSQALGAAMDAEAPDLDGVHVKLKLLLDEFAHGVKTPGPVYENRQLYEDRAIRRVLADVDRLRRNTVTPEL